MHLHPFFEFTFAPQRLVVAKDLELSYLEVPAFPLLLSVLEAGDEEVPDELPARTRRCASASVKIDFSQVSRKRASSSWNREAIVGVSMSVSAMSYQMADSIKDAIPT